MGGSWPPSKDSPDCAADQTSGEGGDGGSAVVLIVDDNERHLDILSSLLQAAGFRTETCTSGLDALFRLGSEPYAAVVLDLVMPGVNGQGVLDRLRTLSRNSDAPVVVCTANVGIARLQLEQRPEIHAIVGKPISSRELMEAVGSAVAVRGSGARSAQRWIDPGQPGA